MMNEICCECLSLQVRGQLELEGGIPKVLEYLIRSYKLSLANPLGKDRYTRSSFLQSLPVSVLGLLDLAARMLS